MWPPANKKMGSIQFLHLPIEHENVHSYKVITQIIMNLDEDIIRETF